VRISGIISEYNPFHNGHKFQLDMLKNEYDAIVCVMSGSFVQRGDIAIFDKWTRAKAALHSGCDLVLELPSPYAISSAQGFSKGAIDILSATGVIDALSFGSESGDIGALNKAADIMLCETPEISDKIRELLKNGYSYPAARLEAYKGVIDEDLLNQPNNILALEYIMELKKRKSSIMPITHKRTDNGYNSFDTVGKFASATKIRDMIAKGEDISEFVPFDYSCSSIYQIDYLTHIFKYILLTRGKDAFTDIPDMEDGLDNRFLQNIDKASITEIIDCVKTKRYTRTRLQRIVLCILSGISKTTKKPEYIRVLGMSDKGMEILSEMKKTATYPIVNKVADFKNNCINPDILATDIQAMCQGSSPIFGRDYLTSPIILKKSAQS